MLRFIVTRLGYLIPTFFGITVLAFAFIRLLPGDPVTLLAGERGVTPERHAQLMVQFGFDKPAWQQYFYYVADVLQGDLGRSVVTREPVLEEFFTLFPATLELSFCAIVLAVVIGLPAGVIAAVKRGSWFDHTLMGVGPDRLFDADLLVGADPHHPVLDPAAVLDAGVRAHRHSLLFPHADRLHADRQPAVGPEGRLPLGAAPPDPALHSARDHPAGGDRAADALGHARSAGRGLCAHGAGQGPVAVAGRRPACPAGTR
jgi:hypothetical protein